MHRTAVYAAAAVVALAVTMGVVYFLTIVRPGDDQFAACRDGLGGGAGADIGGPFTLTDENGNTVTDEDVFVRPSLVYFGYSYCPDVCPLDNVRNADAVDLLKKRGYDVQPVFISVDPKRDTPEVLRDFTDAIHPDMVGLTGTPEQLKAAAREYRVYFKVHDDGSEDYLIDHSTFTYLVLPKIGFVDFFKRDTTAEDMAQRVGCYLDAANR